MRLRRGCDNSHVGDIERARVCRPVSSYKPRSVHSEAHRQLLEGDVVAHLQKRCQKLGRLIVQWKS
jgi:hypothetical protein